ncbi:MAG: 3-deoxy-manno-octulosonate cytidylyltransferase [Armatimonadetes bacterium]|nr:3-deoxy-manno-octulosonate cytidylyltransferase [Armatimonadota bacterium]
MRIAVIIPARMSAARFPGKPLADLCGKPMIQWVYERAGMAASVSRVIVATCDAEIVDAVELFGGEAVMTSDAHRSGTDRLAEAAVGLDVDIVVNVQGDEPLIDPSAIEKAIAPFIESESVQMVSLMAPIDSESAKDQNLVKVVVTQDSYALYFSRSPIPYERKPLEGASIYGHVGLYAYTKDFLLKFASLEPTPLEQAESLEQLRALEHGYRIKMVEIADRSFGVDTLEDLERAKARIMNAEL